MALTEKEVLEQSRSAFRQWCDVWDSHSVRNGETMRKRGITQKQLSFTGIGKTLLCIANGPSFERHIETIKKYQDNVDIACVDKCFPALMDHGIKPNFVFLADAGMDYEKYAAKYDQTNILLICNVTSNPEWGEKWAGPVSFYVNKDNIGTEIRYGEKSGCKDIIPASSNVGNSVIVFSAQVFGYDEYLLVGYDYCWFKDSNYYAFEDSVKRYWMNHLSIIDIAGDLASTSQNLLFSARWMTDFYNNVAIRFGTRMFNCSGRGILSIPQGNLERRLKRAGKRAISEQEKNNILRSKLEQVVINSTMPDKQERLNNALSKLSVTDVIINYIPPEVMAWLN